MTAFARHFSFEFRSGVRNRTSLLMNYLLPLGFYLVVSSMMTGLNPDFRASLIPAMVFFAVLSSTFLGLPEPIVSAREAGIFRSYKIHGIPEFSILVIPALTILLHMIIVTVIIVATAPTLFQATLPTNWLGFIAAFVLMVLTCTGLALLLGVIAPNSRSTVLLSQAIYLPSMLIGGLMFPTAMLPEVLGKLALLLPTTHAMNIYNVWARELTTTLDPLLSAVVLGAGAILAFGMAVYLFNWDSQNRTQRGHPALALLAALPFIAAIVLSFF